MSLGAIGRTAVGLLAGAFLAVSASGLSVAADPGAEPLVELTMKLTPKRTGTLERPQGVRLSAKFHSKPLPAGVEPPIMLSGKVLLPRGIVFNGGDYPSCSKATMESRQSTDGCPKRSIMGSGRGTAYAETGPKPTIEWVNGGARKIWAFTTFYVPALVREPVGIRVTPLTGGRWGSELSWSVPSVLQVIAGIPITVQEPVSVLIGGKSYAKELIVTNRRCPERGFMRYRASFTVKFNDGHIETVETPGRIPCS